MRMYGEAMTPMDVKLLAGMVSALTDLVMKREAEIEQLKGLVRLLDDNDIAAEIERLKAENAELRKSLNTWIALHGPPEPKPSIAPCDDAEFGMKP